MGNEFEKRQQYVYFNLEQFGFRFQSNGMQKNRKHIRIFQFAKRSSFTPLPQQNLKKRGFAKNRRKTNETFVQSETFRC